LGRQSQSETRYRKTQCASGQTTSVATLSAQDPAGHQPAEEAHKEEPPCASPLPPCRGRCDESTQRCNGGDHQEQKNHLCRSERPHSHDPTPPSPDSASSVIVRDQSEHQPLASPGSRGSPGTRDSCWMRGSRVSIWMPKRPDAAISLGCQSLPDCAATCRYG
ncbi:MAG: hypothetical protein JWQ31_2960, partial [Mycobacterium sp.]|nr:hypothetical protein [Mycobacterium sp.]